MKHLQRDTLNPELVTLGLKAFDKCFHADFHHVRTTRALHRPFAVLDPAWRREVCRFGTIEAVVETGVVAVRERDHEFTCFLNGLQIRDRVVLEYHGRDHSHLVPASNRARAG